MATSRRNWPAFNGLRNDPAQFKSRFLGTTGESDYARRVDQFNRELAMPADRRDIPPIARPSFTTATTRLPGGYQTGDPVAIARRYSMNPSQVTPAAPMQSTTATSAPTSPAEWNLVVSPLKNGADESGGVEMPQGNAAQRWADDAAEAKGRWMANGGSSRTFNRANVAAGVRSAIDARSNPSVKNSTTSADIRENWGWQRNGSTDLPY